MPLQIKKTSDAKNQKLKIIIYAQSGRGKTSTLASLPVKQKNLLINLENGFKVLDHCDHIDVIDITGGLVSEVTDLGPTEGQSKEDFEAETITKMQHLWYILELINSGDLDYDTIAIDSISEVGELIIGDLMADPYYADPKNSFKYHDELRDRQLEIFKFARDITRSNVIFLALEDQLELDHSQMNLPAVSGKRAMKKLPSLFDEVLKLEVNKERERFFITDGTTDTVAKSRTGLPAETTTADLGILYFGQKTPSEDYLHLSEDLTPKSNKKDK